MAETRGGLILGVDGGATKTIALVATRRGEIVGAARNGSSDIHGRNVEQALDNVVGAVREAIAAAGGAAKDVTAAVMSLCGADWPEDFDVYLGALRERVPLATTPVVLNDGFGALRAGTPDGVGVAITVGTGLAIGARGPDGRRWHSGYWPEPAGAHELGRRALVAIVRADLGIDDGTAMRGPALATVGVDSVEALLHAMTRLRPDPVPTDRLTPILLAAAADGDGPARRIVAEAASRIADYGLAAARAVGLVAGYPLVLAGGVLRHPSGVLEAAIASCMTGAGTVTRPDVEPAVGVLLLAFDEAGLVPDGDLLRATMPPASLFETGSAS